LLWRDKRAGHESHDETLTPSASPCVRGLRDAVCIGNKEKHMIWTLLIAALIFAKAAGFITISWLAVGGISLVLAIPMIVSYLIFRRISGEFKDFNSRF
jgi:hypothetical protein